MSPRARRTAAMVAGVFDIGRSARRACRVSAGAGGRSRDGFGDLRAPGRRGMPRDGAAARRAPGAAPVCRMGDDAIGAPTRAKAARPTGRSRR
ncbi:hypothetical protein BFR06_22630 [Burkholderia pseudomallei]|nr:hypothetical protein BK015_22695 [Burkholderia pseudomallei]KEO69296.1 hypothetical protein J103_12365 [Burkholderia pseudomallei MSHR5855]APF94654.1 hypothetical protein BFR05_22615 [Burkholderia pseudomallei]APG00703.1 hypothetical protein BFR06_22630 [Burkholderia pseudomallei]ARK42472.1 hypothetical protein BOC60_19410 [Burkholderia pseudomallei]